MKFGKDQLISLAHTIVHSPLLLSVHLSDNDLCNSQELKEDILDIFGISQSSLKDKMMSILGEKTMHNRPIKHGKEI